MNLSNVSISVLIVTCMWLLVIVAVVVSKYKSRTSTHLVGTERRLDERRGTADDDSVATIPDPDGDDNRREGERRETKDWELEVNSVRIRIENETGAKEA